MVLLRSEINGLNHGLQFLILVSRTVVLVLVSALNIHRLANSSHRHTQQQICNKLITKYPVLTKLQMLSYNTFISYCIDVEDAGICLYIHMFVKYLYIIMNFSINPMTILTLKL